MTIYNFDEVIDRRKSDSVKWATQVVFGREDAIPMWVADMDFRAPQAVMDAIIQRAQHGVYGYALRPGSYQQAIIDWWSRRHNWTIEKPWILSTNGVVPSIGLAVLAFTNPGDKIIVQPPIYPPFFSMVTENGRQLLENPLKIENGQYVMDYEDLERKAQVKRARILVLCSPHNPVGRVWSQEELRRLGEICLKHNILVVSDEIHCDLILAGHKHIPLASISPELANNTITLAAPTKTFNIAGLVASYAIIPNAELHDRFCAQIDSLHMGGSNIFGVLGLEIAYNCGEEWLDQLLKYLALNLDLLDDFVRQRIPSIQVYRPEGTYLAWLDCRGLGLTPDELKKFMLEKAGLGLNDGIPFGPGGEGFQRLNVACPRSILLQALEQLEKAVNSK